MDKSENMSMDIHLSLASPVVDGAERKGALGVPDVRESGEDEKQEPEDGDACGCKAAGVGGLIGLLIYATIVSTATWRSGWLAMSCMGLFAFMAGVLGGKFVGVRHALKRGAMRSSKT
jgi:hypothetical protein